MRVGEDKAVDGGEDDAAAILSGTTELGVEGAGRELGARSSKTTQWEKDVGDCTALSGAPSAEDVGGQLEIGCVGSMAVGKDKSSKQLSG